MTAVSDPVGIARTRAITWHGDVAGPVVDDIAVEEPLEIRLAGVPVAVTMRTPGNDADLAVGFLLSESILRSPHDILSVAHCDVDDAAMQGNVINVNPADPELVDPSRWDRRLLATAACGVCGKASLERVWNDAPPVSARLTVSAATLTQMPDALRAHQHTFERTGGVHAAALFDARGNLLEAREDVGRHNAVDKVIGATVRRDPSALFLGVLMVSSRASFEIVQKARVAGIPIVATVSAPSSLAIQVAAESGITLIGFLRGSRFNVYAGEERIQP